MSSLGSDPVAERRRLFTRVGAHFQDSAWQPDIRVGELFGATACLWDSVPDWREVLTDFDLEKKKLSSLLACMHRVVALPHRRTRTSDSYDQRIRAFVTLLRTVLKLALRGMGIVLFALTAGQR